MGRFLVDKSLRAPKFEGIIVHNCRAHDKRCGARGVLKLVVMITDAQPGGFCSVGDGGAKAHQYALQAKTQCAKINAIQVRVDGGTLDPAAQTVMLDYEHTTCGWFFDVPHNGTDIALAVDLMLSIAGYCNCP